MDSNNNNNWIWLLLLFGLFWLLYSNSNSRTGSLFVVTGHEEHLGLEAGDGEDGQINRHPHKSHAHNLLDQLSNTHQKVSGWYETFDNLAGGAVKILTAVTSFK